MAIGVRHIIGSAVSTLVLVGTGIVLAIPYLAGPVAPWYGFMLAPLLGLVAVSMSVLAYRATVAWLRLVEQARSAIRFERSERSRPVANSRMRPAH